MKEIDAIPYQSMPIFSGLIKDYLNGDRRFKKFSNGFPKLEDFSEQIKIKSASFGHAKREVLVHSLLEQYQGVELTSVTEKNIELLKRENTFTITTGHQLNIFTGPLYFLYKIVSVINLTKKLKQEYPENNFIPVYWMATEDHDFEEIQYFNVENQKIVWDDECNGAVGRKNVDSINKIRDEFAQALGSSDRAKELIALFDESYKKGNNLTESTRTLVNTLFGDTGLVIIDGDDKALKKQFVSVMEKELLENCSFDCVTETNKELSEKYNIQVNPREINLFYLRDGLRERIVFEKDRYIVLNTQISFTESEILDELNNYPHHFSPNVILRPLYQETILPNLAYVGGAGELSYWFQLKSTFEAFNIPKPIVLLRNAAVIISPKQLRQLDKLDLNFIECCHSLDTIINKKVKERSSLDFDFSNEKEKLASIYNGFFEIAKQTDKSFIGAVNAQFKKQTKGLEKLEKRLVKAEKKKQQDYIERLTRLKKELFPNNNLQERQLNFSQFYTAEGKEFIPALIDIFDPLIPAFNIIAIE